MTRKFVILFAILAIAYATVDTPSPSSGSFSVAPGKLFTNATDTAFTSLTGPCEFTGGFDNTTNYVWCQTAIPTTTVPYAYQRRAINASSPATINATADAKLTTSHYAETNGMTTCSGAGYFGIATGYGTGSGSTVKPDVYFSYAAVNATSFTKVTLTANSDSSMVVEPIACFFDAKIFYIIYKSHAYDTTNKTQNAIYIQGVNVTSGAVYYNSTGGVKLWSPTSQSITTINAIELVGNNQTGYATQGLFLYSDSSSVTSTVGSKYYMLPITLSTGAAGSAVTLATGATSSASASATYVSTSTSLSTTTTSSSSFLTTYLTSIVAVTTSTSSSTFANTAGTTITTGTVVSDGTTSYLTTSTDANTVYTSYQTVSYTTTATDTSSFTTFYSSISTFRFTSSTITGSLTSTMVTDYSMSAFGSLSTYGVVLMQTISTTIPQATADTTYAYANSIFVNGSTTASTTANLTNPSGYYLREVDGFALTAGGYCLIEAFASTTTSGSYALYKDSYYYNGTSMGTSTALGTWAISSQVGGPSSFEDATGSIWLGWGVGDSANSSYPLVSAYAGEVMYQNLSANTLSSIFATLTIMIAALFVF